MISALSPLAKRLIAIGLLVVAIAFVIRGVIMPVFGGSSEQRQTIAEQREALTSYRRIAAREPDVRQRLATLDEELGADAVYLAPGPENVVAAQLQDRVKTVIEENGGVMLSAQVLPVTEESGFRRITLRVRMNAEIAALNNTVYTLEAEEPYLFLDNIDISSRRIQRRPARSRRVNRDDGSMYSVLFDVFGYVRPS